MKLDWSKVLEVKYNIYIQDIEVAVYLLTP